MSETCATCRFWNDKVHEGFGECRRYPPTAQFSAGTGEVLARTFSPVEPDAWCGEHQPREPEKPKAREPGWYWVDDDDGWEVWEFLGYANDLPCWEVPAVPNMLTRDPTIIGPRLDPPA